MASEHNQPPQWVIDHAAKVKKALGLQEFGLYIEMVDTIDNDDTVAGSCRVNYRYLYASIKLRRDIENTADGREYVTHEIIHAAMFRLDQAIDSIVQLLPKALKEHARDLWRDGNEQTVSVLARAWVPIIDALDVIPDPVPATTPQQAPDTDAKNEDTTEVPCGQH